MAPRCGAARPDRRGAPAERPIVGIDSTQRRVSEGERASRWAGQTLRPPTGPALYCAPPASGDAAKRAAPVAVLPNPPEAH